MAPKATKAPLRVKIGEIETIYVCFWIRNYTEGQMITVKSDPGEGAVRCQLLTLHKETKHPINAYGQELTEQWWNFQYIPEKEYHRHAAQMRKQSPEQGQLF